MKISFKGYKRGERVHRHLFKPWLGEARGDDQHREYLGNDRTYWGRPYSPMRWYLGRFSRGLIADLQLHGEYAVEVEFEDIELKNWLKSHIAAKPEEALDLIAEVLPLAVEACKKREIRG